MNKAQKLAVLLQMLMACMTCMAMYVNGAVIGMASIQVAPKPTLEAQVRDLTAFSAAVAGSTLRASAGRQTAASTTQTAAATSLASALFLPSKQGYFHSTF